MRFGRVISFCFLLLVAMPAYVHAQEVDVTPQENSVATEEPTNSVEVTEHAASHSEPESGHKEEGGMPQLDPTYYASQLFWLAIATGLMFILMSKLALPRIAAVLELRDNQVRKDLETAAKLKLEAEEVKLTYLRALRDADERAHALTDRTLNEARDKQHDALEALTARTQQQIIETEATLRAQKEAVLLEVASISKTLSETTIRHLSKKAA